MKHHGRSKVLFGSNYLAWPAVDCLDGLSSLGLESETDELFLHENAGQVFRIE